MLCRRLFEESVAIRFEVADWRRGFFLFRGGVIVVTIFVSGVGAVVVIIIFLIVVFLIFFFLTIVRFALWVRLLSEDIFVFGVEVDQLMAIFTRSG